MELALSKWCTLLHVLLSLVVVKGDDVIIQPAIGGRDDKMRSLESGISDVKSIIMEKYGRHYRLTGGSMLATKRNKPDPIVTSNASAPTVNGNVSAAQAQNVTLLPETNASLTSNVTTGNATSAKNDTELTKSDSVNVTASTKSDIANANDEKANNTRGDIVHLDSKQINNDTVQFGAPPEKPKWFAQGENNYTTEGNLTTITVDLNKGDGTNAVIPGIDLANSPVGTVDIVYTNDTNSPKRSAPSHKPKKNITFQITKPRMSINDFANKRKFVPHVPLHKKSVVRRIKTALLKGMKNLIMNRKRSHVSKVSKRKNF